MSTAALTPSASGSFWADRELGENVVLREVLGVYLVVQRVPYRVRAFATTSEANAFALRVHRGEVEETVLRTLYPV